jgi:type II secretory pathway pseudopilin PulG
LTPSRRHGLVEYLVVLAVLAVAAAGALAFFREPIRAFFGAGEVRSASAR